MPPTGGAGVEVRSAGQATKPRHAQRGTRYTFFAPEVLSMPFRFFTVPIQNIAEAEAELNAFLGSHKVLAVDRQWVDQGVNSFWALCVHYLVEGGTASSPKLLNGRSRVDYKEILAPAEFEVFPRLRGLRKEIATREAIPFLHGVYERATRPVCATPLPDEGRPGPRGWRRGSTPGKIRRKAAGVFDHATGAAECDGWATCLSGSSLPKTCGWPFTGRRSSSDQSRGFAILTPSAKGLTRIAMCRPGAALARVSGRRLSGLGPRLPLRVRPTGKTPRLRMGIGSRWCSAFLVRSGLATCSRRCSRIAIRAARRRG